MVQLIHFLTSYGHKYIFNLKDSGESKAKNTKKQVLYNLLYIHNQTHNRKVLLTYKHPPQMADLR